jgi:transcriptional regulator with XRE-family HTH domain
VPFVVRYKRTAKLCYTIDTHMKVHEKQKAISLRKRGYSLKEIVREVGVAKSSVSLWVRDVQLTSKQAQRLLKKQHDRVVVEKRRTTRLRNENGRREKIKNDAKDRLHSISSSELFLLGIALYWAEGAKKNRGVLQFSNSDPNMIYVIMYFFRTMLNVPEAKFKGHICLHSHLNELRARRYWAGIMGVPISQFYKTSQQHNRVSKNKKDSLPYGTLNVHVCNTELYLQMMGWIERVPELISRNNKSSN